MDKISLALYSYGMDSTFTMEEKLKIASDMGYTGVEFAGGYGGLEATELKAILVKYNLVPVSSHVRFDEIDNHLAFLRELGGQMIIVPSHPFATKEEALEFDAQLNEKGRETANYGLKLGFHNHTSEFFPDEGKPLLEYVIENTDPALVGFELDCGWASAAGIDPVDYINQHAGRFMAIHIKENSKVTGPDKPRSAKDKTPFFKMDDNGKPIFTDEFRKMMEERGRMNVAAGTGIVDWRKVMDAAEAQGCRVRIVEREWSYNSPQDRVACLREDITYLKGL